MKGISLAVCVSLSVLANPKNAIAQVVLDSTLSTTFTQTNSDFEINDGNRIGNNLFHSFDQFSVPTGGSVLFNNATDVQNIFSRVTGDSLSIIDGELGVIGDTNLFLLNPNGILFGSDASLSIGGSFVGTTASSVQFSDGIAFSTEDPTRSPLLTMNAPIGLQMGANAGAISQQPFSQLEIYAGNTLALIGNGLQLEGSSLTAFDGRIELASLGPNAQVELETRLQPLRLVHPNHSNFRDITLSQAALLNVSGDGGGSAQIQGRNILLTEGSLINGDIYTDGVGSELSITATESLTVAGDPLSSESSQIRSQLGFAATGRGSDLLISAPSLFLTGGGQILGGLSGASGQGGNISIVADDIEATGTLPPWMPSGILNPLWSGATGQGGTLRIQADRIRLREGAQIGGEIWEANGTGGDVTILANDIEAVGVSADGNLASSFVNSIGGSAKGRTGSLTVRTNRLRLIEGGQITSGIWEGAIGSTGDIEIVATDIVASGVDSNGNYNSGIEIGIGDDSVGTGGNLRVDTQTLSLFNGAQVSSTIFNAEGTAGNVTVNATNIEASGVYDDNGYYSTGLFTSAYDGATGDAGDLRINTETLSLTDGAEIGAGIFSGSTGNAGKLYVTAQSIHIDGVNGEAPSRLSTLVDDDSEGQGGDIVVRAGEVVLQNGAEITSRSGGMGNAGSIDIGARSLQLRNDASVTTQTASGDGGNLDLRLADHVIIRNQSLLSAEADGTGQGGNILLSAPIIVGLENSDIVANAFQGRGGNIDITTEGIVGLAFRNTLSPRLDGSNDITASSRSSVDGSVQINNLGVDLESGLVQLPSSLEDSSDRISQSCAESSGNQFIASGRGGLPPDPTRQLTSNSLWTDTRLPNASQTQNSQAVSNVQVGSSLPGENEHSEVLENAGIVEASGWNLNSSGQIEFLAASTATTIDSTTVSCLTQVATDKEQS